MLKIRGHHLLCMLLFAGKGYDEEFAKNMSSIIETFRNNPDTSLLLVKDFDDICSHCPNYSEDNVCLLGNDDVLRKDEIVLSQLGLKTNSMYTYKEILEKITTQMTEDCFSHCCNTCRWYKMNCCSFEELMKNCK